MAVIPLMNDVFQLAYVTNDLDQAARIFQDKYGAGEFMFMRDIPDATTDIALAYAGDTNIELLQPVGDVKDFYSNWIEGCDGFALRHHHFCVLIDGKAEMAAIRAEYGARNVTLAMDMEMPGFLDVIYADTTADLGHYLEYIRLEEEGREMFARVPGSPFAK